MRALLDRMKHWTPRAVALVLVWCALAPAAALAAPPFEVPPIGDPVNTEHHPGKVVWAELVTPDLAGAEHFYGGMFRWTFREIRPDYAIAMLAGRPLGGILQRAIPANEKRQSAWLTFIAVADISAADKIAIANGARNIAPAKTYMRRGTQAVFADPEGAVFAMLASSTGDSPDYLAAPGEWIWSSLLTSNPARSADFYKAVFGYQVYDLPSDDDAQHVILASDDYARAGIHTLPPGHRHSHWLNFVRVIDAQQASAQAVGLGGRVLVEPFVDRHGGHVAVVADPYGAPLGLLEWTAADSETEPALPDGPAAGAPPQGRGVGP